MVTSNHQWVETELISLLNRVSSWDVTVAGFSGLRELLASVVNIVGLNYILPVKAVVFCNTRKDILKTNFK